MGPGICKMRSTGYLHQPNSHKPHYVLTWHLSQRDYFRCNNSQASVRSQKLKPCSCAITVYHKKVTYHNRQFQCICCTRSVMSSVNQDTPPRWRLQQGRHAYLGLVLGDQVPGPQRLEQQTFIISFLIPVTLSGWKRMDDNFLIALRKIRLSVALFTSKSKRDSQIFDNTRLLITLWLPGAICFADKEKLKIFLLFLKTLVSLIRW